MIPNCPARLPDELRKPILQFAYTWAASEHRPSIDSQVAALWDELIDQWLQPDSLPLYIRKASGNRGERIVHTTGRTLIACDNATAVWAFVLAAEGQCPTLTEVTEAVRNGDIPTEFTRLGRFSDFYAGGWKLAHIEGVGLRTRARLEDLPLDTLKEHFARLVSPRNLFVVPKRWAGLGEIPEVAEVLRGFEARLGASGSDPASSTGDLPEITTPPVRTRIPAFRANTYRATRLVFKGSVIDGLGQDQSFRIDARGGIPNDAC